MGSLTGTFPLLEREQSESVNRGQSMLTTGMIGMTFGTRSRHAVFPIHRINLRWARTNSHCLRLTYLPDLIRSGAIFEHVQRSPPTFPTMPLHCRSGLDHHQDSRLFPIGPDLQIDLNRERIVAQWNGSINHAGMSSSSDLNSKYSEDYSIYLIYSDWMK